MGNEQSIPGLGELAALKGLVASIGARDREGYTGPLRVRKELDGQPTDFAYTAVVGKPLDEHDMKLAVAAASTATSEDERDVYDTRGDSIVEKFGSRRLLRELKKRNVRVAVTTNGEDVVRVEATFVSPDRFPLRRNYGGITVFDQENQQTVVYQHGEKPRIKKWETDVNTPVPLS